MPHRVVKKSSYGHLEKPSWIRDGELTESLLNPAEGPTDPREVYPGKSDCWGSCGLLCKPAKHLRGLVQWSSPDPTKSLLDPLPANQKTSLWLSTFRTQHDRNKTIQAWQCQLLSPAMMYITPYLAFISQVTTVCSIDLLSSYQPGVMNIFQA